MASSNSKTTFIQADPSTFRAVVQRLTGATHDPTPHQVLPSRPAGKHSSVDMGPRRPAFKLHERRQSSKKLEIKLNINGVGSSVSPAQIRMKSLGFAGENLMVSPVSPLDLLPRFSPRTPSEEEEERAIAGKCFYLHPSPLSTPRGSDPPELLPLFPTNSPGGHSSSSS